MNERKTKEREKKRQNFIQFLASTHSPSLFGELGEETVEEMTRKDREPSARMIKDGANRDWQWGM